MWPKKICLWSFVRRLPGVQVAAKQMRVVLARKAFEIGCRRFACLYWRGGFGVVHVAADMFYVVTGVQAIFQCLQGLPEGGLRRIILTASGGAFRDWPVEKLREVTAADAVKHPNWRSASHTCLPCSCAPTTCSYRRFLIEIDCMT